jgi:tetratricopeptide (TPR) repeat protein
MWWIRKSQSRSIPIVALQFRARPHVTNRPTSAATNPPGAPGAPRALLSSANRRELVVALLLFGSTLLVYAQVWNFGYCVLDDSAYVTDNGYVQQGLTRAGVEWSFTTVHDANWIPLTWISLMLDSDLYGVRPGGYHFTNALLHAANAVLLLLAWSRATGSLFRSGFVAGLFALHPLHVESVAWIAERKDVLSIFFGLLSLLAYVRYATGASRWNLGVSWLCLVASLASKQTLVTLPFVFLLLDHWPLGRWTAAEPSHAPSARPAKTRGKSRAKAAKREPRISRWNRPALRLVSEKIPFFAVAAIFCGVALKAQRDYGAVIALQGISFPLRCMNAIYVYAAYLEKTLVPYDLAIYYPHPFGTLSWLAVGLAATLLLAVSAAAIVFICRLPFLFVGWFWYLGTLVPMIGLVQIGSQQMGDRYTYFPLIGVFLAATWLVAEFVPAGVLRTRVLPAAAVASLLLLAATSYSQIGYWHDNITLLRHSQECTADSGAIHEFLGSAELLEGDPNEAVAELKKALAFSPNYGPVHRNLGTAYQRLGRFTEASAEYQAAIALGEQDPETYVDLGVTLFNRGQAEASKAQFLQALAIDPNSVPANYNLALACSETKDFAAAVTYGERALQLDPNLASCHVCVALALEAQGHLDESIRHMQRAVELEPNDRAARQELARMQSQQPNAFQTSPPH